LDKYQAKKYCRPLPLKKCESAFAFQPLNFRLAWLKSQQLLGFFTIFEQPQFSTHN